MPLLPHDSIPVDWPWHELPPPLITILDALSDVLFVKDANGRYLFINQAGADGLLRERESIIGRTNREILPANQADAYAVHDRVALLSSTPFEFEQPFFNGETVSNMRVRLKPLLDDAGKVWGLLGTARAVTAHSQAEESPHDTALLRNSRENQLQDERGARMEAEMAVMRLEAILSVTDTALTHLDSDHLLDELLERICTLLQADSAALWLMEADGRYLAVRAMHGVGANAKSRERVAVGEDLIGRVALTCEPVAQEDALQTESGNLFINEQLRASVGVPLVVNERVTGVLHVGSVTPRLFSSDAVHLLQLVADRAANAIERAQLFNQVRVGKQELDELSRRLLSVQENERRHVARELHDEIGQVLTAVKISLQSVGRSLAEPSPDQQATIAESVGAVESAIASVRDLSLDLRPPMLDELGLVPTLRWFANRQTRAGAFQCLLDAAATPRLQPDIEIACFRVAQEAITNAARHASAANVNIKLQTRGGLLQLTVTDDGEGFDTDERARIARGQSLGLLNMEERVRLAGGSFSIKSKPGGGTTVQALFPLPTDTGKFDESSNMTPLPPSGTSPTGGEES